MMPLLPSASVVIPTCNRPRMLEQCLNSVQLAVARCGHANIEVIVTDDSAGDDSRRLVLSQYPRVSYARGPRMGPASNRNAGVRHSHGNWLMFVDDDCIVDPDWMTAFLAAMTRHADFSVLEGKTVADRQRQRLDEESPVNERGGYLWSCNMAVTRRLFDQLGGFCESFPYASMEDVDFRLRLLAFGERFQFVADAVVCHPIRASKGLRFTIKNGRSYLHLVSRHPQLVARTRWLSWAANAARRTKCLFYDGYLCQFRGFFHGAVSLFIWLYFEFVARLRYDGTRTS
jgi:GT2 family glycosyltransferase